MNCPHDRLPLGSKNRQGTTLYSCRACHGIRLPIKALTHSTIPTILPRSDMPCPSCGHFLNEQAIRGRPVHSCNKCSHAWVDGQDIQAMLKTTRRAYPGTGYPAIDSVADVVLDIACYAPDLLIDGAEGLIHAAEAVGDVVVGFFADLLSDVF